MICHMILGSLMLVAQASYAASFVITKNTKGTDDTYQATQALNELYSQRPHVQTVGRRSGKSLMASMEMIDTKRQPKPKRPMGNDIGIARVRSLSDELQQRSIPDRIETTVSIDLTMSSAGANASQQARDEEAQAVSREIHSIIASVPTMHAIPKMEFHRDPEQDAINQRITQVARQLTESAIRREYEANHSKALHPTEILSRINLAPAESETQAIEDLPEYTAVSEELPSTTDLPETTTTEAKPIAALESKMATKSYKTGKSLDVSKPIPLVSHLPEEVTQLLVAEAPFLPHMMLSEGFQSPPALMGPLLGGPPLTTDGITLQAMHRVPKKVDMSEPQSIGQSDVIRSINFLKIASPINKKFSTEDVVVSVVGKGSQLQ